MIVFTNYWSLAKDALTAYLLAPTPSLRSNGVREEKMFMRARGSAGLSQNCSLDITGSCRFDLMVLRTVLMYLSLIIVFMYVQDLFKIMLDKILAWTGELVMNSHSG